MLDRSQKQSLIEKQLGLKHKLKVNESGPTPQNHKEMAQIMVANWELEDEISAIDEYLTRDRQAARQERLKQLERDFSAGAAKKSSKSKG
jgi:hypothetical protein